MAQPRIDSTPGATPPAWFPGGFGRAALYPTGGLLVLLALLMLYAMRQILAPFVIALVLSYVFNQVVDRLQARLGWPRVLIVVLLYVLVLAVLGGVLVFGAETLFRQTRSFVSGGPSLVQQVLTQVLGPGPYQFGGQTLTAPEIARRLDEAVSGYFGTGGGGSHLLAEGARRVFDTGLVLILTFYLLVDGPRSGRYLLKFVPTGARQRTGYVAGRIHEVLGAYLRGQLVLILVMIVLSAVALLIFRVPYALPIAILSGFLEIMPLLGPVIAAVIAAGTALTGPGAGAAVGVAIAYFVLRQVEDQVVVPLVVGRSVDLHPVVTIFAVLGGGALAGPLGMLLAVPVAAAVKVILDILYPDDVDEALAQVQVGMAHAARDVESEAARKAEGDAAPSLPPPTQQAAGGPPP